MRHLHPAVMIKDRLVELKPGKHKEGPHNGACIMEVAALLTKNVLWTDFPKCTNYLVALTAQRVWDVRRHEGEDEYPSLLRRFLPRLLRARQTDHDDVFENMVATYILERLTPKSPQWQRLLGIWKAAQAGDPAAREQLFIESLPAWKTDQAQPSDFSLNGLTALGDVLKCLLCPTKGGRGSGHDILQRFFTLLGTDAVTPDDLYANLDAFLDELLTLHEKFLSDDDDGLWVPQEWEDEALEFLESLEK